MPHRYKIDDQLSNLIQSKIFTDENTLQFHGVSLDQVENLKLCLDDKMIKEKTCKTLILAYIEKEKTKCLLRRLRKELEQVLASNKLIPKPLQCSDDYFQLDERINYSIIKEEQSKMNKLQSKLAFDYEKSLLTFQNVEKYFVTNILTNKFEVRGILKDEGVKTLYHKLQPNNIFISLVQEIMSKKHPKRRRRDMTVLNKPASNNKVVVISESESFIRNVQDKYSSLPKKIQLAIDNFAKRKEYENQKILMIQNMHENKPGEDYNIEEEALLESTRNSIGYLNLKSGSNFKMTNNKIISMEDAIEFYIGAKNKIHILKKHFNENVFELGTRKIRLIQEYKQFKFDISIIQKILNDPEIKTPSDFPEILMDKFIDPSLIDSFEPIVRLDPMDLFLNPKKSHYELVMQKEKFDKLKYRHMHLHESMLTKINMFDDNISELNRMRIDVKLKIMHLELWATTLEEEMLVLYDFDLLEDELEFNIHIKIGSQNEKTSKIQRILEEIQYFNNIHIKETNMLIDNQNNFNKCLKMKSGCNPKHLKKIFQKKLKILKNKSTDSDDSSSSSSSSDESDESDQEHNNDNGKSLTAISRFQTFDEKVIPLGCDPKVIEKTLELRSKKYEIEKTIEDNKKKLDVSRAHLRLTSEELDTIEDELKQIRNELEACQIKKQMNLNDVHTRIVLNITQITKAKELKNSILLYGKVFEELSNRAAELKKEKKEIVRTLKIRKLDEKNQRNEIVKLENDLKNIEKAIKYEMKKKCITEWNLLDQLEMYTIHCMINESGIETKYIKEHFNRDFKILENKIISQRQLNTDLLRWNTRKNKLLLNIRENISKARQYLDMDQERITEKFQKLLMESTFTKDKTTMKSMYDILLKKKQEICEKIRMCKLETAI